MTMKDKASNAIQLLSHYCDAHPNCSRCAFGYDFKCQIAEEIGTDVKPKIFRFALENCYSFRIGDVVKNTVTKRNGIVVNIFEKDGEKEIKVLQSDGKLFVYNSEDVLEYVCHKNLFELIDEGEDRQECD